VFSPCTNIYTHFRILGPEKAIAIAMLALGASLVLRALPYSLTEAGEPYNVIAPPKMFEAMINATTHSRVDCSTFLEEAECRKKQALQLKAKEGVNLAQILTDAFKKDKEKGKGELKAKAKRRKLKKKKMLAAKKRKARKVKAMIKKVKAQRASSDNATQVAADAPKVAGAIYNETHPRQQEQEQPQQGENMDESKMTVAQKAKKEKERTQAAQKEARQEARDQRKRLHTPGQDWNSTTPTSCWSMDAQASGEWCNSNCQAGGASSECASWCCCQVACNGWTEKSMPPSMKAGAQNTTLPEPEFQGVPWGETKKARRAQKRLKQKRKNTQAEEKAQEEETKPQEERANRKGKRKNRKAAKRVHFD